MFAGQKCEEPRFECSALGVQRRRVVSIAGRNGNVLIEYQFGTASLVRAQVRSDLAQKLQRLAVGDRKGLRWGVALGDGALSRDFARVNRGDNPIQESRFSAYDTEDELASFVRMPSRQCDGPFAVDQPGEVGRVGRPQLGHGFSFHP